MKSKRPGRPSRARFSGGPGATLRAAVEAHRTGQFAVAEALYAQAVKEDPRSAGGVHRHWAALCTQTGRLEQVVEHLTAALSFDPGNAELMHRLGGANAAAGRLADAAAAYRRALARRPDFAAAFYDLGNVLRRQGLLSEAAECYRRAVAIVPKACPGHIDLGVTLQMIGDHANAAAAFRRAIAIDPRSLPAQFNLGMSLAELGRLDEAIAAYHAALQIDGNVAAVHGHLGLALEAQHRVDEAIACYERAVALDPSNAVAFSNLGSSLRDRGRLDDALAAYRSALKIEPNAALIHVNLGMVLEQQHRIDEAISCYEHAIALAPALAEAHKALAQVLFDRDFVDSAFASFRRCAELMHGRPHPGGSQPGPALIHKAKHEREQLEYLIETKANDETARRARDVLTGGSRSTEFFHIERGDRLSGPAINPNNETSEVQARWERSRPNIVVVDDLLTQEALVELRRFCWGSTIWRREYPDGYLGATPESGFAAPLLAQIDEELRARFPGIFRGHPMRLCWAFTYDSQRTGIGAHADFAAVNVNFWITPDDANLDEKTGGLVIWDVPAPLDWDFEKYNADTTRIRDFLGRSGAKSVTVPYRANRAVIFDSDLFHETDRINFKDGYLNRRINVTLLYGLRENDRPPSA